MVAGGGSLGDAALQPVKGSRDFLPQEKLLRDEITGVLKATFEKYGFSPLETPALEKWEVLSSKYAGGEEILKETYSLEDQGGRKLGLRYDLTVPLCRVIAANPRLPMPFKRYQIQRVWRDGPVKAGRYREFLQADVDVVGAGDRLAEAELLALAVDVFKALGLRAKIKVNNRKVLNGVLAAAGVSKEQEVGAILAIDKLDKVGVDGVREELVSQRGVGVAVAEKILSLLNVGEEYARNLDGVDALKDVVAAGEGREGLREMEELLEFADAFGIGGALVFKPWLARGLSYYTGAVFEAFLDAGSGAAGGGAGGEITSSVAAGGRYDDLIGAFSGRGQVPACGISFGVDVLTEALKERMPSSWSAAKALVVPVKELAYGIRVAQGLRARGAACALDLVGRSVGKNLEWAAKNGFAFAVIVGPKEREAERVTLRNLASGEEKTLSLDDAAGALK